jgi:N-acetylglucosamine kinase-like BadF-type ATPase
VIFEISVLQTNHLIERDMKLYLGIDGGGSHSTACLSDDHGNVIARAGGGLGNPNHASDAELTANFTGLLARLFPASGPYKADCVSVFAGMAGVTCQETGNRVRRVLGDCGLGHATIGVDHDIRVALAGGLTGRPGIALIAGTGSSCYGRNARGDTWQSGGWGSLIGDEGSGYSIGRNAMAASVRMADGRQPETPLGRAVFDWLGISDVSEILERIYGQELTRPQIAAFAPTVLQLAAEEDIAALEILSTGAHELALMVAANHDKLPTATEPEVVITGGLGTAENYSQIIESAILHLLPQARVRAPELDAATGAALLAIEQISGELAPEVMQNLKGTK